MGSPDAEEEDEEEDEEEEEEFDVWGDGELRRELGDYYHLIVTKQQLRSVAAQIGDHARRFVKQNDGTKIKTISDDDLDVEGKGAKVFEPDRILQENL